MFPMCLKRGETMNVPFFEFLTEPSLTTLTPSYTFSHFGDYDVLVRVTDTNGESSEDGCHVSVTEVAPTATVTTSGPVTEGGTVTSTLAVVEPDSTDTLTVYASWQGGDFEEVPVAVDGSGAVTTSTTSSPTPPVIRPSFAWKTRAASPPTLPSTSSSTS